jgi:hypothetical protein
MKTPAILLFALMPLLLQAQKVSVYTDDFSGSHVDLAPGKYDYQALSVNGASSIASFKVPAGLKVTLFAKNNFEGNSLVIIKDITPQELKSKGFGWNTLNFPSLVIERAPVQPAGPYVTIYQDNFSGEQTLLGPGKYEFADFGFDNDQLSSVRIPKGLKVRLYEHAAFQGRSLEFTNDVAADELVRSKFNDKASSLIVEVVPEPAKPAVPVVVAPVVAPVVQPATPPVVVQTPQPAAAAAVTIYSGDFSGSYKELTAGKYSMDRLGIGNDELSSVSVPKGFRVELFDDDAFEGRSVELTADTRAADMVDLQFNNLTSSIIVHAIPMVTIFDGDYAGARMVLDPGRYKGVDIAIHSVSSVKVPAGYKVTLFEKDNFQGRSLVLTHDTGTDYLARNQFDNITSSLFVETAAINVPMVTLFHSDFSGKSARFSAGRYDFRDGGYEDNMVASVRIPRGLQVTLYESGSFRGRSMVLRADAATDFFREHQFSGIATSMVVEEVPAEELFVTLYEQVNTGFEEKLGPGRYNAANLRIGDDRISSVRIPKGMRVTLHEDADFLGRSMTFDGRDADLTISKAFDNRTSSLIVEDIFTPVVTPVAEVVAPAVVPAEVVAPVTTTSEPMPTMPPCEMTSQQYDNAANAINSKSFRSEKMDMARLATKGKCMTNNQIRSLAKLFSFEDQTLEFVKYAYDLSTEQSEYYTMADMFAFMSSKDDFTAFLKSK